MMQRRWQVPVTFIMLAVVAGCATNPSSADSAVPTAPTTPTRFVQLPMIAGWHENERVHYITTDVSDRQMAEKLGANYVPRLALTVPEGPPTPGRRSALERIYLFTNFNQGNIVPSVPSPVGPDRRPPIPQSPSRGVFHMKASIASRTISATRSQPGRSPAQSF